MRSLFAIMLFSCEISNPLELWEKYCKALSQDILFGHQQVNPDATYNESVFNRALILLEDHILHIGGQCLDNYGLPKPNRNEEDNAEKEIARELTYDADLLENHIKENEPKLTVDQKVVYDMVMRNIN